APPAAAKAGGSPFSRPPLPLKAIPPTGLSAPLGAGVRPSLPSLKPAGVPGLGARPPSLSPPRAPLAFGKPAAPAPVVAPPPPPVAAEPEDWFESSAPDTVQTARSAVSRFDEGLSIDDEPPAPEEEPEPLLGRRPRSTIRIAAVPPPSQPAPHEWSHASA